MIWVHWKEILLLSLILLPRGEYYKCGIVYLLIRCHCITFCCTAVLWFEDNFIVSSVADLHAMPPATDIKDTIIWVLFMQILSEVNSIYALKLKGNINSKQHTVYVLHCNLPLIFEMQVKMKWLVPKSNKTGSVNIMCSLEVLFLKFLRLSSQWQFPAQLKKWEVSVINSTVVQHHHPAALEIHFYFKLKYLIFILSSSWAILLIFSQSTFGSPNKKKSGDVYQSKVAYNFRSR